MRLKSSQRKAMAYLQFNEVISELQSELIESGYSITSPVWDNLSLQNMPNEEWVSYHKYKGYEISNYGRIKSNISGIILRQYFDGGGYLYVSPNNKKEKVHRMVGFAFYGKDKKKIQINHKKGYKWYNVLLNLEWSTPRDNQIHSYETGLKKKFFGKENITSIPIVQYDLSGKYIREWESMKMAARDLNIDDAPIAKCCKGNINYSQAYCFVWRYKKDVDYLGDKSDLPINQIKIKYKPKFQKRRQTTERNKHLIV